MIIITKTRWDREEITMYPVNHFLGAQRNGVNHVSMNLSTFNRASGPVRDTNYPIYSDSLITWYKIKNVKSVRLMFTWEAVQPTLNGPVPGITGGYADYWADLAGRQVGGKTDPRTGRPLPVSVLKRLLDNGIYVILSPWQYNSKSGVKPTGEFIGDTDIVYNDTAFTSANFADFWGKFATAINAVTGSDQRVAFDLINEPHTHAESGNKAGDIGISLTDWFGCAQAAIRSIRDTGATNTIFVPGMAYASASSFTTNGSAGAWLSLIDPLKNIAVTAHCYDGITNLNGVRSTKPITALRDACSALISWARTHGIKVNIGEIALDAGDNGRPSPINGTPAFCSTFPTAQAQWTDWNSFCLANNDVVVGWNWWGNSTSSWWNQGDSCDPEGYHWGLTLDDGVTQTVYMDLIQATLPTPTLVIPDNLADSGMEPNTTTTVAWESPAVWVRQSADGGTVGEPILGGAASVVYVSVTNKGTGPYNLLPGDQTDVIRLYWAKAAAGLSWPAPWNGSIAKQGGTVAPPQPVGTVLPGQSKAIAINWPATPNPADYPGGDGHFCLLALITKSWSPEFEGFLGSDLNQNVLKLSTVAWRNIHIVPVAAKALGDLVIANHTDRNMRAHIAFEILDARAKPIDPAGAKLSIRPRGGALDKLRTLQTDGPLLKLGHGAFEILELARGIPRLDLRPEEVLSFELDYVSEPKIDGYAVRVTQLAMEGDSWRTIGGQTFVVGNVEGFTMRHECHQKTS